MSGIAGVVAMAGAVLREPLQMSLDCLLTAMAHRGGVTLPSSGRPSALLRESIGTGRGSAWTDPACALGIQFLPRTPEDAFDHQPLRDAESGCVLVWDGRLDNREELAAELQCDSHEMADSAMVLRAFLLWKEDCAARLLGDFAFAVWDPRTQTLFAARDIMGVRPLFYTSSPHQFALASEVHALLTLPGVSRAPDEVMAGEALLWWSSFSPIERTFYRDVRRLPPAHWLRWDTQGLCVERYWDIDPGRQIRYARRAQYLEEFADLLRRSVACRLRTLRPAGIFLSGGMDSSAVATVASALGGKVRGYHFQLADDEKDESAVAQAVARRAGAPLFTLPLRSENGLDELSSFIRLHRMPFADLSFQNDIRLAWEAAREGCGAVLTGDGSDELFGFAWGYVGDLLRKFRWLHLARIMGSLSAYLGRSPAFLLLNSLPYAAPRPFLAVWRTLKWRSAPPWIAPQFAKQSRLLDRLRALPAPNRFRAACTAMDYVALMRGRRLVVDERRDMEMARLGLEFRFPFYDRRLLEFMFAVPWDQKMDGVRPKPFLDQNPALLPEEARNLPRKANYGGYSERLWRAQQWSILRPLFDSPSPAATEYLHWPAVRKVADPFLDAGEGPQREVFLQLTVFLLWLAANDSSG